MATRPGAGSPCRRGEHFFLDADWAWASKEIQVDAKGVMIMILLYFRKPKSNTMKRNKIETFLKSQSSIFSYTSQRFFVNLNRAFRSSSRSCVRGHNIRVSFLPARSIRDLRQLKLLSLLTSDQHQQPPHTLHKVCKLSIHANLGQCKYVIRKINKISAYSAWWAERTWWSRPRCFFRFVGTNKNASNKDYFGSSERRSIAAVSDGVSEAATHLFFPWSLDSVQVTHDPMGNPCTILITKVWVPEWTNPINPAVSREHMNMPQRSRPNRYFSKFIELSFSVIWRGYWAGSAHVKRVDWAGT